ncbi:MAG: RDD family protein, partial [Mariprofundaceae bacterium]
MAETVRPKAQKAGILIRTLAGSYDLVILFSVGMVAVGIPITISTEIFGTAPPHWIQFLLSLTIAYSYFVG